MTLIRWLTDMLPDGHGGGFAGGAAHAHSVHPGGKLIVDLPAEGVVINVAVLVEGGDQGGTGAGKDGGSHRQNILSNEIQVRADRGRPWTLFPVNIAFRA